MIMMNHPYADPFISPNASPEAHDDVERQQHAKASSSRTSSPSTSPLLSTHKYHVSVPAAVLDNFARSASSELAVGCEPRDRDVVCGRGKGSYNRPGNVVFRNVIRSHIHNYLAARTKFEKTTVLNQVIDHLHNEEDARFLKFNSKTQTWSEITDDQAREKVGHTMRETIAALDNGQPSDHHNSQQKRSDLMMSQRAIFEAMMVRSKPPPSGAELSSAIESSAVASSSSSSAVSAQQAPTISYRMPWDDDDDEQGPIPRTEV